MLFGKLVGADATHLKWIALKTNKNTKSERIWQLKNMWDLRTVFDLFRCEIQMGDVAVVVPMAAFMKIFSLEKFQSRD